MSKPEPLVFDVLTRDLCNLASKRVFDALMSVVQLADTDAQRTAISLHIMSSVAGAASASYSKWQGIPMDLDDIAFMEVVFAAARNAGIDAKTAGLSTKLGGHR